MEQVIYECKDNGNRIKFVLDDDIVEEIHIQTHDSESWVVISMNDLLLGLSKSSQLPLINHLWLSAKTNCTEKCTCHAECYHADKMIGQNVAGRSEQLKCEHKGRRTATELVEYCEDCKKILFHP